MLDFLALQSSSTIPHIFAIVYSIALSFVLSTLIALTYRYTFQGLSYSRNYLQTLVLAAVVGTIALQAIGDNLARGLGMMGALSMIRFRASLKEPKDLIFVFAALSVGVATGVNSYTLAMIGAVSFCIISIVLFRSPFSAESYFDGLLRFNLENKAEAKSALETVFQKQCAHFALVTLREAAQGERLDYAYQIKIKKNTSHQALLNDLQAIPSLKGAQLLLQESTIEV